MTNSISATGLKTDTRDELLEFFTLSYQTIYGNDINIETSTPDGQQINIYIQSVLDLLNFITQVYSSFDPDNAIGNVLDQRVAINGIQRQAATYTTTNVTIVLSGNCNLDGMDQSASPIFTVADGQGNQWQLITSQSGLTPGTYVFTFQSANPGKVTPTPNNITIPVTIVLGVQSINNPTTYLTLGLAEESDAALKIRRSKSVSLASQGYFQGLTAALENIPGITSALVKENDGVSTDTFGIPGHSIWVIVSGNPSVPLSVAYNSGTTYSYGSLASDSGINYISITDNNTGNPVSDASFWSVYNPVAQTIYNYRNAGCGLYNSGDPVGAQSYSIVQIDGSSFAIVWDNVLPEDLFIYFEALSLDNINPPDIAAIKTYIVNNYAPGVFEEVNFNQIGTLAQQEDPNTLVVNAGFAESSAGPFLPTALPTDLNYQFAISENNIIVYPIILSCPNGVVGLIDGAVTHVSVNVASGGTTIQFTPVGGFASYTYAVISGAGSIDVNGLYTSATAGTDTVQVTDGLTITATAVVTVV